MLVPLETKVHVGRFMHRPTKACDWCLAVLVVLVLYNCAECVYAEHQTSTPHGGLLEKRLQQVHASVPMHSRAHMRPAICM